MKKQTSSEKINQIGTLFFIGSLLLTIVLGCSFSRQSKDGIRWNLQEACGYLDDVGVKARMNKSSCNGGGKLDADGKVKDKQADSSATGIASVSYFVDPDRNVIKLQISREETSENFERSREIFADYCEKLFQRALGVPMSEETGKAILANQDHLLNIESPKVKKMVIVFIQANNRPGDPYFELQMKIPSKTL